MAEINFEQVLLQKREVVWREIQKYLNSLSQFPDYCKIPRKYSSLAKFHQKLVSDYPQRRGKYIRPTLVLLTAEAMGVGEEKAVLTAAAMQTSEDWILIHDDIEDDSLQRRGQPALHRVYGKELAINAGDGLHVLMWRMLRDNLKIVGQEKGLQLIDEFCRMLDRTVLGQTIEIKWTQEGKVDLTDEDVLLILESKTGYYTIAGPMRLGAILAGASERQLISLYEFGKILGRSFQIVDDLLDLTSDFKGLKKQIGNDIYEGKRTIMLTHLLRTAKGKDKKKLLAIMEKPREKKIEKEVVWVIEAMKKYGSLDHGKTLAEQFANQARNIFKKKLGFLNKEPAKSQLVAGIDFIIGRNY